MFTCFYQFIPAKYTHSKCALPGLQYGQSCRRYLDMWCAIQLSGNQLTLQVRITIGVMISRTTCLYIAFSRRRFCACPEAALQFWRSHCECFIDMIEWPCSMYVHAIVLDFARSFQTNVFKTLHVI